MSQRRPLGRRSQKASSYYQTAYVEIDPCHSFSLALPDGGDFYGLDLSQDKEQELKKVQGRSGSE